MKLGYKVMALSLLIFITAVGGFSYLKNNPITFELPKLPEPKPANSQKQTTFKFYLGQSIGKLGDYDEAHYLQMDRVFMATAQIHVMEDLNDGGAGAVMILVEGQQVVLVPPGGSRGFYELVEVTRAFIIFELVEVS